MIDLHPTVCNLCGGEVVYQSNKLVYGKEYGSGMCYFCLRCGAYVGTHKPRPEEALGILANKEMRTMKSNCHKLFDRMWHDSSERHELYIALAEELGISEEECHFGYFDLSMLNKAYRVLKRWSRIRC
jgi:hypothetical protein